MDTAFGLTRDPFGAAADGGLFWETPERAELRSEITHSLAQGNSSWLSGPAGAGRRTLLNRVASDLAGRGVPVAVIEADASIAADRFLATLASVMGVPACAEQSDLLALAEQVYRRLVEVFCATRPAVLVLPWEPVGDVADEVRILTELNLVGHPLVAVAAIGTGPAPVAQFDRYTLPPLELDDVRDCLSHRCAAVGRVDLLPPEAMDRILESAQDLATALSLARTELLRLTFAAATGNPGGAETLAANPVLDPYQVEEVGQLLDSLSAESDVP